MGDQNQGQISILAILKDQLSQSAANIQKALTNMETGLKALQGASSAAEASLNTVGDAATKAEARLKNMIDSVKQRQSVLQTVLNEEASTVLSLMQTRQTADKALQAGIDAEISKYQSLLGMHQQQLLRLKEQEAAYTQRLSLIKAVSDQEKEAARTTYESTSKNIKIEQDALKATDANVKARVQAQEDLATAEEKSNQKYKQTLEKELQRIRKETEDAIADEERQKQQDIADNAYLTKKFNQVLLEIEKEDELEKKREENAKKQTARDNAQLQKRMDKEYLRTQKEDEAAQKAQEEAEEKATKAFNQRVENYLKDLRKRTAEEKAQLQASQQIWENWGKALEGAFTKLRTGLSRVANALNNLMGGRYGSILLMFSGVELVKTALDRAEDMEEANQKLRVSLRSNADLYETINGLSENIAKNSEFDAIKVKEVAAFLAQANVPADKLAKTLQTTFDVAAALNKSPDTVASELAATFGGVLPRELKRPYPFLNRLDNEPNATLPSARRIQQNEALKQGAVIDQLAPIVGGTASAFLQTPAGQLKAAKNELQITFSEIGDQFLILKARIYTAFADLIKRFDEFLKSDFGRVMIGNLSDILAKVVELLPELVAILAAIKSLEIGVQIFNALAGAVQVYTAANAVLQATIIACKLAMDGFTISSIAGWTAFGAPIWAVVAAVAAVSLAVLEMSGNFTETFSVMGNLWTVISDVIEAVKTGTLSIVDIFDIVVVEAQKVFNNIKYWLYDMWIIIISRLIADQLLKFDAMWASLKYGVLSFANTWVSLMTTAVKGVATAIDWIVKKFADASQKVGLISAKTADNLRKTNIAGSVPTLDFSQDVNNAKNEMLTANEAIVQNMVDGWQELKDKYKEVQENNNKLDIDLEKRVAARQKQRQQDQEKSKEKPKTPAEDPTTIAARLQAIKELEAEIRKVQLGETKELMKQEEEMLLDSYARRYKFGLETFKDYFDARRHLSLAAYDRDIADLTESKQKAEALYSTRPENSPERLKDLESILEIEKRRQQLINERAKKLQEINDAEEDEKIRLEDQDRALRGQVANRSFSLEINEIQANRNRLLQQEIEHRDEIAGMIRQNYSDEQIKLVQEVQYAERIKLQRDVAIKERQLYKERADALRDIDKLEAQNRHDRVAMTEMEIERTYKDEVEAWQEKLDKQLISQEEFDQVVRALEEKRVQDLKALNGTFFDGMKAGLDEIKEQYQTTAEFGKSVMTSLADSWKDSFSDAFVDIVDGTSTVADAFRNMAASILKDIAKIFAQRLASNIFASVFGGVDFSSFGMGKFSFNNGGIAKFNRGGFMIPGYASGSIVRGKRQGNRDTQLAALTVGEGVIQQPAVDYYGEDYINAVNRMIIPQDVAHRSVTGGGVPMLNVASTIASQSSNNSNSNGVIAAIPANDKTVNELLRGGRQAFLEVISDYKTQINGVLNS